MKEISVALINPPSPFLISDSVMPPLGIMYLSSYLKHYGFKVKILDMAIDNSPITDVYDIYAFTSTTPQYPYVIDLLKGFKKINPFGTFVIGGAHATAFKEKCRNHFDTVVIGEGERALLSVARFVEKSGSSKMCGIIKSEQILNIDSIPFPDRTFEGFDKYHYHINGLKATTVMSSRGCPFNCYFCYNTWGNKVRLRSAENVLEEIKELKYVYGFKAIMLFDDTFTANKRRVIDIAKGLKDLGIIWRCFIHANTVDSNLLRIMHKCGCIEVGMGVESGNDNILRDINKKTDIEKAIQVCNWCHEIGLRIKTFLMIGLPGESKITVDDTIGFLRKAKPDDFDYTIYTPFPSTYIWDNAEGFDIQFDKQNLDFSKMFYKGKAGHYCCQVSTSYLTAEKIEELRDYVDIEIRKEIKIKTNTN